MQVRRAGAFSAFTAINLILAAAVFAPSPAEASGFYVREQSTSGLGTAYAGAAAGGSDASYLFFNGAAITEFPKNVVTIDVRGFIPQAEINSVFGTNPFGTNITALGDSGGLADNALAPSGFAALRITDNLSFGLALSSPFAVIIETRPDWAGEFQLLHTELVGYNINPMIAYRFSPVISVAVGIQIQYFNADMGKTEVVPIGPGLFVTGDGFVNGDGWGVGVTAGVLITPNDRVRLGFSYRSHIDHDLRGTAGLESGVLPNDGVRFTVTTPDVYAFGFSIMATDRLTLLGEVEYTGWSRFDGFRFKFDSGRPDDIRAQTWRDTWFFALGGRYAVTENTTVSAGASFEQAASVGSTNTLSPDGDRIVIGIGAEHRFGNGISIAGAYGHMFISDAPISVTNLSGAFIGTFSSGVDIFSVSATARW
ncbi:MAG: outer membrane protein transport protein [Hyphomicrobiales bacterium]|nr:outer membrane protein transport protein [Hyphomicrobiales bacterium]